LPAAMAAGRVGADPQVMSRGAEPYHAVRAEAAQTKASLVAAKLQRATGPLASTVDLATEVLRIVNPPDQN